MRCGVELGQDESSKDDAISAIDAMFENSKEFELAIITFRRRESTKEEKKRDENDENENVVDDVDEYRLPLIVSRGASTDVGKTGEVVWPMGRLMGHFILSHAELFRNKRVIELGAGTGIGGLVAAHCGASEVTLTDHVDSVLSLCERSIARQLWGAWRLPAQGDAPDSVRTKSGEKENILSVHDEDTFLAGSSDTAKQPKPICRVARLAWEAEKTWGIEDWPANHQSTDSAFPELRAAIGCQAGETLAEIFIGSDVAFWEASIGPLCRIMRRLFDSGGCQVGYIAYLNRSNRIDAVLLRNLEAMGIQIITRWPAIDIVAGVSSDSSLLQGEVFELRSAC